MNSTATAICYLFFGVWVIITAYQWQKPVKDLEESKRAFRKKFTPWLYIVGVLSLIYALLASFGLDNW